MSVFALVFVVTVAFSIAPLLFLLGRTLASSADFALLFDAGTLKAFYETVRITAAAAALSVLLTVPTSWILVRTNIPFRSQLRKVLTYPYFVPPYLFAAAWVLLAVPQIGLLNRMVGSDFLNIYSVFGLVWVLATAYAPILLTNLTAQLRSMDPSLEEAARISGAGPAKTFFRITLPCLMPSISAAALLFALSVMAAFGIPAIVGNPARIYVLTTKIYTQAKMGGLAGVEEGFIISWWLLILTGILLVANSWITRRYSVRLLSGKVPRHSQFVLSPVARTLLFVLCSMMAFITVILPLGSIVLGSFLKISGNLSPDNFTLDNYTYLLSMPEAGRAFTNSFGLAAVTALFCTALGFLISYFKDRTLFRGKELLTRIASLPFAIPGTVIALAMIVSYGTSLGEFSLLGSAWLIAIAYTSKYLALSVQTLSPALSAVDQTLDEAGRICGASRFGVLRKILVPILLPSLVSVFVLTSLPILTELTMSVLLAGPGTETLGTLMFQLQEYANPLAACALSTCLIVIVSVLLLIQQWLTRRVLA